MLSTGSVGHIYLYSYGRTSKQCTISAGAAVKAVEDRLFAAL